MQIIQKVENMKNYFVISICEKLSLCEYYIFILCQWKWGTDFMFQKKYFENVKTFFRVPIIALRFIDWEINSS